MIMTTNDISTWRILIVDDEPDNLSLASELLTFSGATVATANSGAAALAKVHEWQPNMILLDLSMPLMDGWDVQRQLRDHPEFDHIPIIALTALAMPEDVTRAKIAGFNGYITKPFRVTSLLRDLMICANEFVHQRAATAKTAQNGPENRSTSESAV